MGGLLPVEVYREEREERHTPPGGGAHSVFETTFATSEHPIASSSSLVGIARGKSHL